MLGGTVEDRPLALLRAAVLIAARDPAGLLVPAVFPRHAVEQALLALIRRHARRRLTIDERPEVKREVHRVGVVDRYAPALMADAEPPPPPPQRRAGEVQTADEHVIFRACRRQLAFPLGKPLLRRARLAE